MTNRMIQINTTILLLCLLCGFTSLAYADKAAKKPRPIAALAVRAKLVWTPTYVHDPLLIRITLYSPKVEQSFYRASIQSESGKEALTVSSPKFSKDWAQGIQLRLSRVDKDGKRTLLLSESQMIQYLIPEEAQALIPITRSASWLLPTDIVTSEEGRCVLEASWKGKNLVEDTWLDSGEIVRGNECSFDALTPPEWNSVRTQQLYRLAYASFVLKQYESAQKQSIDAVKLMSAQPTQLRISVAHILANSCIALKDYAGAQDAYQQLLDILPPADESDLTVFVAKQVETLTAIQEKQEETQEEKPEEVEPEEAPADEQPAEEPTTEEPPAEE